MGILLLGHGVRGDMLGGKLVRERGPVGPLGLLVLFFDFNISVSSFLYRVEFFGYPAVTFPLLVPGVTVDRVLPNRNLVAWDQSREF